MAVRIARAFSNRDKIAFSGYHGWSDWYLAANLQGENLADHLLPGLEPKGVPQGLKDTAIPFLYNSVSDFERLLDEHHDVGVVCIEGARYDFPKEKFLKTIMRKAKEHNLVIISDEITSGWRMTDGGVYKLNGFSPDIVVYAKAMGGGYAISAVVGSKDVMDVAQDTFISSTMWTERIGFAAGLATIDILTRDKTWEHLIAIGEQIGKGWQKTAQRYGLDLTITDFKPLITFKLNYGNNNNKILTFFIQEMLKRGYLAASSVYVTAAHDKAIVDAYLKAVDEVFSLMADAVDNNNIDKQLETTPRSDAFKRLTL
jgi:glutamate-1-semialdehyde 2,1-aminomutase